MVRSCDGGKQEGMDEDPLKASKKRTSLFLGGQCMGIPDINGLVANMAALVQFMVAG